MRPKITIAVLSLLLAMLCVSCDHFQSAPANVEISVKAMFWSTNLPGVVVQLAPGSATEAGKEYAVQLYASGEPRETTYVSWSQAGLNSKATGVANFPMTSFEDKSYQYLSRKELRKVFTVEIRE